MMKKRNYLPAEQAKARAPVNGGRSCAKEYLVDLKAVNAKSYREKFEKLPLPAPVQDALHKEAVYILDTMNGKGNEILSALDARTGELYARSNSAVALRSGFTYEQYRAIKDTGKKIVLLHNHPGGGRFSRTDINTCFKNDMIEASVVVGHDGSVRIMHDFDRSLDIDALYQDLYNEAKEIYPLKSVVEEKALNSLYDWCKQNKGVKYETYR